MEQEYQQVLNAIRRDDTEVLAAFRVGSRVYGTATPDSDWDYLVVLQEPTEFNDLVRQGQMNITVKGAKGMCRSLREGTIFAWEAVCAPLSHVLKHHHHTFPDWVRKDDRTSRQAIAFSALERAASDYGKGIKTNNPKRVYHAFRVLDFATQILESGRIYDYVCAQKIYEVVMTEPGSLESAFQEMFDERYAYIRGMF